MIDDKTFRALRANPIARDAMNAKTIELLGLTDDDFMTAPDGKRVVKVSSLARALGTTEEELIETARGAGIEPPRALVPNVQLRRTIDPRYGDQREVDGEIETSFTAAGLLRFFFELDSEDISQMGRDVRPLVEQFQRLGRAAIAADSAVRSTPRNPQDVLEGLFGIREANEDLKTGDPILVLRRAIERASALRAVR